MARLSQVENLYTTRHKSNVPAGNGQAGRTPESRVTNPSSSPDRRKFYYYIWLLVLELSSKTSLDLILIVLSLLLLMVDFALTALITNFFIKNVKNLMVDCLYEYEFSYQLENQRFFLLFYKLQQYNLYKLFSLSKFTVFTEYIELCSVHTFIFKFIILCSFGNIRLCTVLLCTQHISGFGLTCQRAAQCNGILISILVFPIKPHYMKTQIQISYLRICIFHFSCVPIDLPTVSVTLLYVMYKVQYFAPTVRVQVFAHTYGYGIRCTCFVHTVIVHLHILVLYL